jgi:hypothetical protein
MRSTSVMRMLRQSWPRESSRHAVNEASATGVSAYAPNKMSKLTFSEHKRCSESARSHLKSERRNHRAISPVCVNDAAGSGGDRLPSRTEGSVKLRYWILFVAVQAIGLLLPSLGNVHSNIAPILIGPILLLPGSLIDFFLQDSSWWGSYAVAIGVNLTVWYFVVMYATKKGST